MEYAVLGFAVALVGVKYWLDERRERRWHKLLDDLLNRKMARDFYDYVNGTEVLSKSNNPQAQLFKEIEQQIKDKREEGPVKGFINDGAGVSETISRNRNY